jgi:hypothetical protein
MTISDQVRRTLRECGEPMTLQQMAEANGWDSDDRHQASKNIWNMKKAGELLSELTEEKVHYRLNPEYTRNKSRGPGLHFSKGDGERTAPRALAAAIVDAESSPAALDKLQENVRGSGLTPLSVLLSAPAVKLLDALLAQGLHGLDRADAVQSLVYRQLERMLP